MVISKQEHYDELVERMNREAYVSTPIFRSTYRHYAINEFLCVGYSFLNGDFYMVSVSHRDAPEFPYIENTDNSYYTNNKFTKGHDIELMAYIANVEFPAIEEHYTPIVRDSHNLFFTKETNRLIPLMAWSSIIKSYHKKLLKFIDKHSSVVTTDAYFFTRKAVQTLREIEFSGLAVDNGLFDAYFENKAKLYLMNSVVYTEYYPYTTTGRPSNRFGGINFAALNKTDGTRSAFVSRFASGSLLQMDFESYHLRLIGNYMGIEMPNEPIHTYLAKQYFGKDTITQEEYDEGKQITFSILYGNDVDTDIPLLKSIRNLSKQIFATYQTDGLKAPYSGRNIIVPEKDATENKLFNYFVQSLEFETTVPKLSKILRFLEEKQSKLLLYTYDAVLLDCHPDELEEVQRECSVILSDNVYPVRTYVGMNYHSLKEVV